MSKILPPYLGAAYYPEAWSDENIEEDIALMLKAGINVVRIGEFAWSTMEPTEGQYEFQWLHDIVERLGESGIAVIMCTPTCTPPSWLSTKHNEILVVNDQGIMGQHGARRHACPNNKTYRAYCKNIVTNLVKEFAEDENIIGWQIDNEMYPPHGRGCCCTACYAKFLQGLEEKYKTIENLNNVWGLKLWSMEYSSFDQIPLPRLDTWHHPSLIAAWMDFQSDSYVEFSNAQAEVLHRFTDKPIGTDMMPFLGLDYNKINSQLDVVQFNHYNSMGNLWKAAFWMDYIRPIKDRPFWNTETSTCWSAAAEIADGYREKGFCKVNSWLPIALGGEANLYWLWRAHWSGQELMHGSVISSCGRPLHMFKEVQELAESFKKSGEFLRETKPVNSGLAMHVSCKNSNMADTQPIIQGFIYNERLMEDFYHPIIQNQWRPDLIDPAKPLEEYKVIITPFLLCLDEADLRNRMMEWVNSGGTWIVGPLTDIRTMEGTKFTQSPFGSIEKSAGVYCKYQIPASGSSFPAKWSDGSLFTGSKWFDGFELEDAEAIVSYTNESNEMEGLAAVTRKSVGKGKIIVLGTIPSAADIQKLLAAVCKKAGLSQSAKASPNLLVVPRAGDGHEGMIVVELEHKTGMMTLERKMTDLLTGVEYDGEFEIPPYKVLVLN